MSAATKELADLCKVLLTDSYGELAANVVGVLFNKGPLEISQIGQHLSIPQPAVSRTLVALVQNRFVLYWERQKKTYYYSNWEAIYTILWSGPVLVGAIERYGGSGDKEDDLDMHSDANPSEQTIPEIVKNIIVYGHMKTGDFIDAYQPELQVSVELGLAQLVRDQVLSPVKDFEFWPQFELRDSIYSKHLTRLSGDKSAPTSEAARKALADREAQTEIDALVKTKYELAKTRHDNPSTNGGVNGVNGRRRPNTGSGALGALLGGGNNNAHSGSLDIPRDTVLALDYDKFLVVARNEALVKVAAKRIGRVTSKVYAAALACYEPLLHRCNQEIHASVEYTITTMEIAKKLGADGDVTSAMLEDAIVSDISLGKRGRTPDSGGLSNKRARRANHQSPEDASSGAAMGDYINDYEDGEDEDEEHDENQSNFFAQSSTTINPGLVNQHLQLLADNSVKLLQNVGNKGGGEWFIPFKDLMDDVRRVTYDEIMENKYGTVATRILRVVREKGKVDEKMLTQLALIPAKDIRSNLTDLQNIGCLELQEIPRGVDRAPGRTFYLWFHRPHRAYTLLIEDLYRSMTRIYSRIQSERQRHLVLNAKLQREDVKDHEDEFLSLGEKEELRKMRQVEERLVIQLLRIDSLVRLFRDY